MSKLSITDSLDLFYLDCQARRLTTSTMVFYREKLGAFAKWLQKEKQVTTLDSLTSTHIKAYLVSLQARGLKDTSQHDHARAIKTFCNFLVRDELLDKSPFIKVKMPQLADRLPVVLTDKEIKKALKQVRSQRNRIIIRFVLDSGVRAAELLALNVGDVDLSSGVVTVRNGKQQKDRLTVIGLKTRKDLKHYLLSRDSPPDKAPLISTERGDHRLGMIGLMSAFRLMRDDCEVTNLTAHTLRRTMATKSLELGMSLHVLARMLGHSDLQMLRKYAAVRKELLQEQAAEFGVMDSMT